MLSGRPLEGILHRSGSVSRLLENGVRPHLWSLGSPKTRNRPTLIDRESSGDVFLLLFQLDVFIFGGDLIDEFIEHVDSRADVVSIG